MRRRQTTGSIGIVGAGTMGAGIAQVALEAGHDVRLHDADPDALQRARDRIHDGLVRRLTNAATDTTGDGRIDELVAAQLERLSAADSLPELAAGAWLVIEAAVEDLALKRRIFAALDDVAPAATPLASNTSALSIDAIAMATQRPERVLGLHFFNPAPVMALVEIVAGPRTDPKVAADAAALMTAWGKTPVACSDSPGFIVNRVIRPFTLEALRMLEAGDGSVGAIDRAVRDEGFPMGPFELMDLVGIDVNLATTRGIWEALGRPARLRPSPIQESLVADGRLGRKSGRGFYDYGMDGRRIETEDDAASAPDRAAERIRLAILDEAHRFVDAGVASRHDVDLALRLGAGHPEGPFAWEARRADLGYHPPRS
jgi:3-hydroxybutyryl-CoA dehydrogenase